MFIEEFNINVYLSQIYVFIHKSYLKWKCKIQVMSLSRSSPIPRFSLESHFKYIVYDLPGTTCQIQTRLLMLSIPNHNI
jgi:hypothetical protein